MKYLSLIFLFCTIQTFAQSGPVFRIDSLPVRGIVLDKGWKWHAGDNPEWAKEGYDDSGWESIDPTKDLADLPKIQKAKIGWLRLKISLGDSLIKQTLVINIQQTIHDEIYLNGKIIARIGNMNSSRAKSMFKFHLAKSC